MFDSREHVSEDSIDLQIESSFKSKSFGSVYRIKFSNKIITDIVMYKGEQRCCYNIFQ